ncbi:unnamed protein product [Heligmosomoides polygyrus]|uniref:Estradiol 17-beta-dehydrogenase 11 n=1 Tax=Heligmosomoides polygyrus TaxID=6339 RepID=A0A3P7ZWP2_HELPZ|nr:unnamed protein product [Heligmosomoides polygyrus]
MARESFTRRTFLAITFLFVYMWCVLFKDLPRLLFQRRKKIENQVVVITGGAMGIGKAVAKLLAHQEKAKICILDVNEKEGLKTVDEITSCGGIAQFFRCDVSDPKSLDSAAAQIRSDPKLGPVSICIANAAVLKFGECLELSNKDFRTNADVNILGHIFTIRAFLPDMIAAQKGQIVSIGSICSYFGEHYGTAYCAAKFACRGFMEALQMELIAKGLYNKVVLTSVYPYFVRTGFIDQLEEPYSTFYDVIPLEQCSSEVVDAVLKEKLSHFIPSDIGVLCVYLKCLITRSVLPLGRKVFNFSYKPKAKQQINAVEDV